MSKLSTAARLLSRRGSSKGGKARNRTMTAAQRQAIARKAAYARWNKK